MSKAGVTDPANPSDFRWIWQRPAGRRQPMKVQAAWDVRGRCMGPMDRPLGGCCNAISEQKSGPVECRRDSSWFDAETAGTQSLGAGFPGSASLLEKAQTNDLTGWGSTRISPETTFGVGHRCGRNFDRQGCLQQPPRPSANPAPPFGACQASSAEWSEMDNSARQVRHYKAVEARPARHPIAAFTPVANGAVGLAPQLTPSAGSSARPPPGCA